jgi:hypothetical protein
MLKLQGLIKMLVFFPVPDAGTLFCCTDTITYQQDLNLTKLILYSVTNIFVTLLPCYMCGLPFLIFGAVMGGKGVCVLIGSLQLL